MLYNEKRYHLRLFETCKLITYIEKYTWLGFKRYINCYTVFLRTSITRWRNIFLYIVNLVKTYRHSFPRVLLSSALWRLGYCSPNLLLAAWAHTINAFIGRLTWVWRLIALSIHKNSYEKITRTISNTKFNLQSSFW